MRGRLAYPALLLPVLVAAGLTPEFADGAEAVEQPIRYNHYKHTQELELDCTTCHEGVREATHATLPGVETCIGCHEEAVTDSSEEEKIRQYYSRQEEIPWQRLFQVPDHVFFSHRRHVTVAALECATCHGDMALRTSPPEKAPMAISMDACLACHRERGASIDCVSCHR
jgi:hypothetical protein